MQETALMITIILMGLLSAAFIHVITRASDTAAFDQVAAQGYRVRNTLFKILLAGGLVVAGLSLPRAFEPIRAWTGTAPQTVHAVGYQWYWDLDKATVIAGKPVEFLVSSNDVTHGFGLYDKDLQLIAQTQVMPGYTNRLNVTFDKPGTYRILCLEYCGLAHHDMVAEIAVVAADATTSEGTHP